MPIYRIAIPAHVIFDVKAETAEEALQYAREVQLENDLGWDLPGGLQGPCWIDGHARCYVNTEAPAPTHEDVQDERDESELL